MKKIEFMRAIEVDDEPSAFEGLDIDSMAVDKSYDGAKLGKEMTQEFIDDMITRFKNGRKLHRKYVYQIIAAVKKIVYDEPTMVEMEVQEGHKLTVCGDTHGQFFDLMELFRLNGFPRNCITTSSTAISSTEAHGQLRSLYSSTPTSGYVLMLSS